MSQTNDEKILELKALIEKKKTDLATPRSNYITNMILEFGQRTTAYNLNTMREEALTNLLVELNAWRLSVVDLGLIDYQLSGYTLDNWISDIKSRLDRLSLNKKRGELTAAESRLSELLSTEKKTELELDSISKLL